MTALLQTIKAPLGNYVLLMNTVHIYRLNISSLDIIPNVTYHRQEVAVN